MLHGVYQDRTPSDHRGPSEAIWSKCPWLEILENPAKGYTFFDDFVAAPVGTTNSNVLQQGYYLLLDNGPTGQGLATEVGGVFQFAAVDADDDEGYLITGGNVTGMGKIASTSGKDLWFEARIRCPVLTDWGMFIGMAAEGTAVAGTIAADATAMADLMYVGFRVLSGDPDGLDAVHRITGGGGEAVIANPAQVLTASAWYKVGFKFDASAGTLKYYVDNAVVGTVTDVSAATFPDGHELALLAGIRAGAATDHQLDLDWWRFAQLR